MMWTILFARRSHQAFVRSCHNQLLKKGLHRPETSHYETFRQTAKFSRTNPQSLEQTFLKLASKIDLNVVCVDYEQASDPDAPSTLLLNVLNHALPQQFDRLRQQMEANTANPNLNKTTNPGLNEWGLELAVQARTIFKRREWKLFRKFLEKNFAKSP